MSSNNKQLSLKQLKDFILNGPVTLSQRDVRELLLAADRLPAAVRRGGAADRPAGAAALHGTEPLYGGEAGGDGAAVKGGVDR